MNKQPMQLPFTLQYNIQPSDHRGIRKYLDQGWRIRDLQRLSDREALITFEPPTSGQGSDA